ncbi:MAG: OmpA family protein [Burkholderiaceae bacterium]|nr:OmpA family protein [Burkholderiaceae bacterium]
MRNKLTVTALAAAVALSGCTNMTQTEQDTLGGAALGAIAGAAIGSASGNAGHGAIIGAVVGGTAGHIWSSRMEEQRIAMQRATHGTGVQVTQTADNRLKLYIPSDVSFQTGRADISPRFARILDRFAMSLNYNPGTFVTIIGHTDSSGSDSVNLPLSRDRAFSVRNYLVSRGVDPNRFAVEGRGSYEPLVSNATPRGRARNRRVEIFVAEPARQ